MSKQNLLDAIATFAAQRPNLEPRNYFSDWKDSDGRANYRRESRRITKDLHHARALLGYVARHDSITTDDLMEAASQAYSGRLEIKQTPEGYKVDYCTGQYFPTEYRRAVACVLALAIVKKLVGDTREARKKAARRELGATLTREFFN